LGALALFMRELLADIREAAKFRPFPTASVPFL
jgi:hypothetical protein